MHAWLRVGEAEALEERKGGFVGADLVAWQPDGRALFPVYCHCSSWPALTSTYRECKILQWAPQALRCARVCLGFFSQRVCLCLVDITASPALPSTFSNFISFQSVSYTGQWSSGRMSTLKLRGYG